MRYVKQAATAIVAVVLAGTGQAEVQSSTTTASLAGQSIGGVGIEDGRDALTSIVAPAKSGTAAKSTSSSSDAFGPPAPVTTPPQPIGTPPTGVPAQCLGRQVEYRDWNCSAQGDGTYFANEGPGRLGFTVTAGVAQIIRFRTPTAADASNYSQYHDVPSGRISVATDGGAWNFIFVSKNPCDLQGALALQQANPSAASIGGGSTGGQIIYVAMTQADYDAKLTSDPLLKWMLRLDPGEYYYLTNLNATQTDVLSADGKSVKNSIPPDTCADLLQFNGHGGNQCYYLAFEGGGPPNTIDGSGTVTCHDWTGGEKINFVPPPPKHYSAPSSAGMKYVPYAEALLGLGSAYPTGHQCSGDYAYYANPELQASGQYVLYANLNSPPECAATACFRAEQFVQTCQ